MSKFFFYVACLQTTFATMTLAETSHAQSLEEVYVSCNWQNTGLDHVFSHIQQQTDFSFTYNYETIKQFSVARTNDKVKLSELLRYISSQTDLKFSVFKTIILVKKDEAKLLSRATVKIQLPAYNQLVKSLSLPEATASKMSDFSPERILSGVVRSADDNTPLVGASVVIKETGEGTTTDADGNFSLPVSDEAKTLVVSYIGYFPTELTIGNQTQFKIQLNLNTTEIEKVVVIGYGTQSKEAVTGSVGQLKARDIKDQPITSFDQGMVGRVPGLDISLANGAPGGPLTIDIRGASSITGGNSPLIVIDGVPLSNSLSDDFSRGRASLQIFNNASSLNPLAGINPNDIESIEILKDAAATAIYGSRGSNGVLLITTKRGTKGEKPVLSFNTYAGVQSLTKKIDVMNAKDYADYVYLARGLAHVNQNPAKNKLDDPNELRVLNNRVAPHLLATRNGTNNVDTDWQDEMFRNAGIQDYELSIRGGTDKTNYYLSGSYFNQDGIMISSGLKRYSARLNLQTEVSEHLRFGLNFNPSFSNHNLAHSESAFWKEGLVFTTLNYHPNLPVYNADGSLIIDTLLRVNRLGQSFTADIINPVALATYVQNTLEQTRLLGNAFAEVDLLKGLSFRTSVGLDMNFMDRFFYRPRFLPHRSEPTSAPTTIANYGWTNQSRSYNWISENYFTYKNNFGNHNVNLLMGFSAQKENNKREYVEGNTFPNDNVTTLNAAQTTTGYSEEREASILSYLGRVMYDYNSKYLFSASLRRDGSSRFGKNSKWGWFPSVSAGWRISEESFFPDNAVLSEAKIRGSWGITGNTDIPFFGGSPLLATANYVVNGRVINGLSPQTSPNPNLSWEQTTTTDVGVDLAFFKNKLSFTADYYISNTKDLLLNVTLPATSGFTTSLQNIGKLQNKGLELQLSTSQNLGPVRWTGSVNFFANKNEIKALAPGQQRIIFGGVFDAGLNDNYFVLQVGEELGSYFGYKVNGVFENAEQLNSVPRLQGAIQGVGDLIYADINGDGVVNVNDRTILGSNNADYTWGFNSTFEYKGFDFSFNIQAKQGFEIFNSTFRYLSDGFGNIYDNWRTGFEGIGKPRPVWGIGNNTHVRPSELHINDGSFVRVRNITLGYTLPNTLLSKYRLTDVRVYVSALNPFTFDDYIGYNPEVSNNVGDAIRAGEDFGNYPLYKSFTVGLNVNFK